VILSDPQVNCLASDGSLVRSWYGLGVADISPSLRILVTGSRTWDRKLPIAVALLVHSEAREDVTLVHGGARGADRIAASAAEAFGWDVEEWLPNWEEFGRTAGFYRNLDMVRSGADLCIAFTRDNSHGTAHCARAAEAAGIPTIWIYYEDPDA